eukprot:TRINITY_DN5472_c0_g2_i1.p1 TRINITY_DN5472_c0_g2~~TRINITY_DN5472_c0_g2_i1.p1  ORF type:complete len:792 (-),score=153.55 TRINITY_DN5472_c0_g2_i1:123-2243(-)
MQMLEPNIQLLCLEGLMTILDSLYERTKLCNEETINILPDNFPTIEEMENDKKMKTLLDNASKIFNRNPNEGLEYLQGSVLPIPLTPESVAQFLRNNRGLSKKKIGIYLGKNKDFNKKVYREYCRTFKMNSANYLEDFRFFFESYLIPGEAEIISRLLTIWSEEYYEVRKDIPGYPVKSADGLYFLSYCIIMANVSLHNPNMTDKDRMSYNQFISSLEDENDGDNFPEQFLYDIYHGIANDEIKLPEDYLLENHIKEYAWKRLDLHHRERDNTPYKKTNSLLSYYDHTVFNLIWRRVISSSKYCFSKTRNQEILEKTLNTFRMVALVANHFCNYKAFDSLIVTLSNLSKILKLKADNFHIAFGKSRKSQLATIAMFTLCRIHCDNLREGWKNVILCISKLYSMNYLKVLSFHELISFPDDNENAIKDESFSYWGWWFGNSGQTEQTEEEKRLVEITEEVLNECKIIELLDSICLMGIESYEHWIDNLIEISKGSDEIVEPIAVACLNLLTETIVISSNEKITCSWDKMIQHFSELLAEDYSSKYSIAVTNLIVLAHRLLSHPDANENAVGMLHVLMNLNGGPTVENMLNKKIGVGLYYIFTEDVKLINGAISWNNVFTLLVWMMNSDETAMQAFQTIRQYILFESEEPENELETHPYINEDNFTLVTELVTKLAKDEKFSSYSEEITIMFSTLNKYNPLPPVSSDH